MSKWYFVNVERGNIADKLQPRNINVSFTNNSNVPIDVIIFTLMMMILLLFLQKQNLASAIYLFGLGTRLSGPGLKHMLSP